MDYKKKYEEALEKAKQGKPIDEIFPELKESEDERIRTRLIALVEAFGQGEYKDEMLAYLERQKEQKPVGWKPQPESLEALMYAIEGKWEMIKPTSYLSRRLEDLYEGLVNTFNVDESFIPELSRIAYTAEDVEELRALKAKIEASMELPVNKPAQLSEEDEYNLAWIIETLYGLEDNDKNFEKECKRKSVWLKSLPERFNLQSKNEWSEKDELKRDNIVGLIEEIKRQPLKRREDWDGYINWLKSLQERFNLPQKIEWNEEDKRCFDEAIEALEKLGFDGEASNLKFLRDCRKPLNSWKPSKEQMKALKLAYEDAFECPEGGIPHMPLKSLLSDLQKLL